MHATPRRARDLAPVAVAGALAAGTGSILVHQSGKAAVVVLVLPVAAYLLLARPARGFPLALALILVLPYWWTLGAGQATVIRAAVVLAAFSALSMPRLRMTWTDCAVAIYVAVVLGGWWLQYDQPQSGHVVMSGLAPVAFYLGARALRPARLRQCMVITLFAGTFGALTVLYEYALGHVVFADPTKYVWNAVEGSIFRPGGVFGSPPAAGTVLTFVLLFGLAPVKELRGRVRTAAIICLGICALALIVTFTRANLIAAAAGLIVFLWLIDSPLLSPARIAAFAAALGVALLVVLPLIQNNATFQEGIIRPGNLTARESIWTLALPIATANPHNLVLGVGTGALETPLISDRALLPNSVAESPQVYQLELHNQYVTTLVEQGIVGLTALALLLLSGLVPAARATRRTHDRYYAAVAASIVSIAVVFTANSALNDGPTIALFMTTLGLAADPGAKRIRPMADPLVTSQPPGSIG